MELGLNQVQQQAYKYPYYACNTPGPSNSFAWTGDPVSSAFKTLYNIETYDIHGNDKNLNYNGNCHECCQTIAYLNTTVEALEREIEKIKSKVSF